jgi:hypothetical protein
MRLQFRLKELSLFALFLFFQGNSFAHGVRGGGNFTAADFRALAEKIKVDLTVAQAWDRIGVSVTEYDSAISTTNILCASGTRLRTLVIQKYHAFYEPKVKTIFLNCLVWQKGVNLGMKQTLIHEYMRAIGKESADYSISARARSFLPRGDSLSATDDLEIAIHEGDVEGIFDALQNGANLNWDYSGGNALCQIVNLEGMSLVETIDEKGERVRDDSRSGALLSVDEKVALIYLLKSRGINPNLPCDWKGETAIFKTMNPVIMQALIKIGADPRVKTKNGTEALIGFLFGYEHYSNKAYFRKIVKIFLDLGADPRNCFEDGSGCIDTHFAVGNEDLAILLKSYLK